MVLRKHELEASLHEEKKLIETGKLKEDNPLDFTEPFKRLCDAVRRGDIKVCQEAVNEGANINGRDQFDYTPLILGSLCGRYEIVQFLLESGALCERDTFQGERCLYNALNDRIRNLLLQYDYSKSTDPLQPFAAHITSLLTRDSPSTSDIVVNTAGKPFSLHKFVLAARSPYFRKKLDHAPEATHWKLPITFPPQSFEIAIRYVYLGELPTDIGGGPFTGHSETEILEGIEKISRQLEIGSLWEAILEVNNRRIARQQRTDETNRGRDQVEEWFRANVLAHKVVIDSTKAELVKWDRSNAIFADILLRADDTVDTPSDSAAPSGTQTPANGTSTITSNGTSLPIGPLGLSASSDSARQTTTSSHTSTLFPAHRAMLLRSEYFLTMFSSSFLEAQDSTHLKIVTVDCSPVVLEAVLTYLYTERADFGLDLALDVLFAADLLLIERLKTKAAQIISALGSGSLPRQAANTAKHNEEDRLDESDPLDPFDILNAAYDLRVPRLEEFAARYLAFRLEGYIDRPEFVDAVAKSAARIRNRQETDSIELIDDIRFYLSERFRLRFEIEDLEEMLGEKAEEGERDDVPEAKPAGQPVAANEDAAPPQPERGSTDDAKLYQHPTKADTTTDAATAAAVRDALAAGEFRTLDGEIAGDEFKSDAVNYQILLGKIDGLLERLQLDG